MRNAARDSSTYLDASSAEALHPAAHETLLAALDQGYADPRRLHREGRTARLLLDNARAVVADALGVRPDEVSFTSSGTDAVHRGLLGLHRARAGRGQRVVSSAVEHSSVRQALEWVGGEGHAIAEVDSTGRVDLGHLSELARQPSTTLVALQSANHEVGTLQPVSEASEQVAEAGRDVPIFVDARASMGRLPLPSGWAALAGSAHLWGGPAGVGVLLVRKRVRWESPFPSDDRSDERISGFENVPAALASAAALQAVVAERDTVNARQFAMIDRIRAAAGAIPDVDVVGDPVRRLPHLLTFSCLYVNGEALVTELDRRGFSADSGSACTSSTLEPSHVLAAMGALTHGNLRLSLTRTTTTDEVDHFCKVLPEVVARCRDDLDLDGR